VTEPPTKQRKTLAERAGETGRQPSNSKSISGIVKASGTGFRNASSSSSVISRNTRNISGASSNSSMASSIRPPLPTTNYRSQTGTAQYRFGGPISMMTPQSTGIYDEDPFEAQRSISGNRMRKPPEFVLHPNQQRRNENQTDNIYPWSSSSVMTLTHTRQSKIWKRNPCRDLSISSSMQRLSLRGEILSKTRSEEYSSSTLPCESQSYIPKPVHPTPRAIALPPSCPVKRMRQSLSPSKRENAHYLTKSSSNLFAAWDTVGRLEDMESMYSTLKQDVSAASTANCTLRDEVSAKQNKSTSIYEIRSGLQPLLASLSDCSPKSMKLTHGLVSAVNELEAIKAQLFAENTKIRTDLEDMRTTLGESKFALADAIRTHTLDVDDLKRKNRINLEDMRDENRRESERARRDAQEELDRLLRLHREELAELEKRLQREIEEEKCRKLREVQDLLSQWELQKRNDELSAGTIEREVQGMKTELGQAKAELEQEQSLNKSMREKVTKASTTIATLEASMQAMKAKITFLESDSQAQSQSFADLNQRLQEAITSASEANAKLRTEESLRRKLHNQVQELKGNIRVFCRVRPALETDAEQAAEITFPNDNEENKELVVTGPEQKSAMGTVTASKNGFSFDRVFGPSSQNAEIFDEISQLVQSALDGYNVCIFCYGQTGSGKTHTMSSDDGMIPRAVHQIYDTAKSLGEKGWTYTMEGSFVEVYNETLNDLLGKAEELDKKKLEIRHDTQKGKTTIAGVTTIPLKSPSTVTSLLKQANANRRVAATKANGRSSRSHSVFILKLAGENSITGERSEGTLNLVDLAGSERIAHSGVADERLKETQNINRSLSCLGDVISALGQGKDGGHIPYRNSKVCQEVRLE